MNYFGHLTGVQRSLSVGFKKKNKNSKNNYYYKNYKSWKTRKNIKYGKYKKFCLESVKIKTRAGASGWSP